MARRLIFSMALLAGLTGLAAVAARAGDAENVALFQGLYDKAHAVYQSRDRAAITALFDEGFVSIDLNDTRRTAGQIIDAIMKIPPEVAKDRRTTVTAVIITGDTANVRQQYHLRQEKTDSSGTRHVMVVDASSRDIWVSHDGAWRIRESRSDAVDLSIDGNVVAHKQRPPG
jgi:hypothetical protein